MDKITFKILELFYYNTEALSVDNISSSSEYDAQTVSASCLYLRNNGYIHTKDPTQTDADTIYPDSFYSITLEGKGCFERICKDNRRFRIPMVLSIIAIIISIIALLKQWWL